MGKFTPKVDMRPPEEVSREPLTEWECKIIDHYWAKLKQQEAILKEKCAIQISKSRGWVVFPDESLYDTSTVRRRKKLKTETQNPNDEFNMD